MSYAIPDIYAEQVDVQAERDLVFTPRSKNQWIAFSIPLFLCGCAWIGGGVPYLCDVGFLIFTLLCGFFLAMEFIAFPRRFGIGGLLLYGGVLCWFCQDYFTHWFNHDFNASATDIPAWVVSKVAFLHVLFVMLMSLSLNWDIAPGRWVEKALLCVPEPGDDRVYLWIIILMFGCTLCPYVVFNAEPWYICIYHALFSGWVGQPQLIVFRTGNLNYSWGAYIAQVMNVGELGGIVGIVYAILVATTWPRRLLGIFVWTFNALVLFETGRRGNICFVMFPPIALLFIKFQVDAANLLKRFSLRPYVICGALTVFMLFVVQFQGTFRGGNEDFSNADLSQLDITKNQGNTMFSEGLLAYSQVGVSMPFFYASDFPGEGAITAIPNTVYDLVLGIIPRALWNDKPIDRLWIWYNREYLGSGNGMEGTTISHGLIGSWYLKYGIGGMIEGALLVGMLMGVSERALQHSGGRPVGILMSLSFATWLFRTFRDFIFIDLYGLILGAIALMILIPLIRPILGSSSQPAQPD